MSKKVLKKAIDNFGIDNQMDMAIEELSELIKALSKLKRYKAEVDRGIEKFTIKKYEKLKKDIIEEIVDVDILIEQIKLSDAFNGINYKTLYNTTRDFKINRLNDRVNNLIKVKNKK